MSNDKDIVELERILHNLQLESERVQKEQRRIQRDLHRLKGKIQQKKASTPAQAVAVSTPKVRSAEGYLTHAEREERKRNIAEGETVIVDRRGYPLRVGDKVYLFTKGAFPATRGTLKELHKRPKLCIILDTDGVEQKRTANNLILETVDTLQFLK